MKVKIVIMAIFGTIFCIVIHAQKVTSENGMAVIDCSGLTSTARKTLAEITASKGPGGRLKRHTENAGSNGNPNVNEKISPRFAVAKKDINSSGTEQTEAKMSWALAAGWSTSANNGSTEVAATATGCASYAPSGTVAGNWRLPTQRELILMWILSPELQKINGFTPFGSTGFSYWSATEHNATIGWKIRQGRGSSENDSKTSNCFVRCVRDL